MKRKRRRANGGRGTPYQAIEFVLLTDKKRNGSAEDFLFSWMVGELTNWPEFYDWLETQP